MSASADAGVKPSRARTVDGAQWRRRMEERQTLLQRQVVGALCGLMLGALCICRLIGWTVHSNTAKEVTASDPGCLCAIPTETSPVFKRKPAALLKGSHIPVNNETGILLWTDLGDGFLSHMTYKDGLLTVGQEGVYFLYSKIALTESMCGLTIHKIARHTQKYSKALDLMLSVRYLCPQNKTSEVDNSYLGGAFLLHVNDSVFVKLEGPAKIRPSLDENIFGAFML